MSEEKNIPGQKSEDRSLKPEMVEENTPQHFPEDSRAPKQLQTSNIEPQTIKEMEVHHHGHVHHQKKWKEYLFQFLMLFLAVFCGFLAEYQLEHKIERDREKQYMRSLIKDLEQDIRNIEIGLEEKELTITIADSLMALLAAGNYEHHTNTVYYFARRFSTFKNNFYMTDGTLTQLKNSGGLRLIRKLQLADSLQAYDNLYQEFEMDQQLEGDQIRDYRDIMIRIFEVRVFDSMVKSYPDILMPLGNPALFNRDRPLINEFLMRVPLVKRNKLANTIHLKKLETKAQLLITQIKKEYHLE